MFLSNFQFQITLCSPDDSPRLASSTRCRGCCWRRTRQRPGPGAADRDRRSRRVAARSVAVVANRAAPAARLRPAREGGVCGREREHPEARGRDRRNAGAGVPGDVHQGPPARRLWARRPRGLPSPRPRRDRPVRRPFRGRAPRRCKATRLPAGGVRLRPGWARCRDAGSASAPVVGVGRVCNRGHRDVLDGAPARRAIRRVPR